METTGSGIFSMSVIQKILNTESLEEAKRLATDAVAKISESGKKIKQENIRKAKVMIEKSKTPKILLLVCLALFLPSKVKRS